MAGVVGETVSASVPSSVVTEGAVSEGVGGGSSAKTRVGLGWLISHGNIGLGRSGAGCALGTS